MCCFPGVGQGIPSVHLGGSATSLSPLKPHSRLCKPSYLLLVLASHTQIMSVFWCPKREHVKIQASLALNLSAGALGGEVWLLCLGLDSQGGQRAARDSRPGEQAWTPGSPLGFPAKSSSPPPEEAGLTHDLMEPLQQVISEKCGLGPGLSFKSCLPNKLQQRSEQTGMCLGKLERHLHDITCEGTHELSQAKQAKPRNSTDTVVPILSAGSCHHRGPVAWALLCPRPGSPGLGAVRTGSEAKNLWGILV